MYIAVVILCGVDSILRDFMITAANMGMTGGDYVYLYITEVTVAAIYTQWINNDTLDAYAKEAFLSLIQVFHEALQLRCVHRDGCR